MSGAGCSSVLVVCPPWPHSLQSKVTSTAQDNVGELQVKRLALICYSSHFSTMIQC